MRTNYKSFFAMVLMATLFTSCQRRVELINKAADASLATAGDGAGNKCRLTFTDYWDGYDAETFQYNEAGLVSDYRDVFLGSLYLHATMQYDGKGRMVTGTYSNDDITFYDIVFEYENKRIVKEAYYEQGTSNLVDFVLNTYNSKGQIIKRDDAPYEWYATFEYDNIGNCIKSEVRYYNGDFVTRDEYSFKDPVKNPRTARLGVPYTWWYLNQEESKFVEWTRDEYFSDGAGGEVEVYKEDPARTIITSANQNLAGSRFTVDEIYGNEYYQYWEYENCGGNNDLFSPVHKPMGIMDQRSKDISLLKKPFVMGRSLKQQLDEKKAIWQKLKK